MNARSHWLVLGAAMPVYLFLAAPLLVVVLFSFSTRSYLVIPLEGLSFRWYRAAWTQGSFVGPALRSLTLAGLSACFSGLLAVPAALGLRLLRTSRLRAILTFVLMLPLLVPALITGIGLLYYFGEIGLIDTFFGLLAAHVLIVLPFTLRGVLASADALEQASLDAASVLGGSRLQIFWTIVLPELRPGLVSGLLFAAVVSLDQFTVSLFVVQDRQITLPIALYKYLSDVNDPVAAAVSTALILFGLVVAIGLHAAGALTRSLSPH